LLNLEEDEDDENEAVLIEPLVLACSREGRPVVGGAEEPAFLRGVIDTDAVDEEATEVFEAVEKLLRARCGRPLIDPCEEISLFVVEWWPPNWKDLALASGERILEVEEIEKGLIPPVLLALVFAAPLMLEAGELTLFKRRDCLLRASVAEVRGAGLADVPEFEELAELGALRTCSGLVRVKLLKPDCLRAFLISADVLSALVPLLWMLKLLRLASEEEEDIRERGRGGTRCDPPPILTLEWLLLAKLWDVAGGEIDLLLPSSSEGDFKSLLNERLWDEGKVGANEAGLDLFAGDVDSWS
jgi:hypothetical protein